MILSSIINNLIGGKSYKKYVSLVSGMILVLIVSMPIIKIFKEECFIEFNKDFESKDFGLVQTIKVVASYSDLKSEDSTTQNKDSEKINKVEIPVIKVEGELKNTSQMLSPDEIIIKDMLSDFYNVDKDNININIQGG